MTTSVRLLRKKPPAEIAVESGRIWRTTRVARRQVINRLVLATSVLADPRPTDDEPADQWLAQWAATANRYQEALGRQALRTTYAMIWEQSPEGLMPDEGA